MHQPEIAIIEPNTLTALGLRTILEELIPEAVIRTFSSFEQLIDDTPDMYAHYFVSAHVYFEHTSFFLERKPKCIVLSAGEPPLLTGIPSLNILLPQEQLVKTIMQTRKRGHELTHHPVPTAPADTEHELTAREIEVLRLVTKGLINKEIAEKLHISLTTVISHRKTLLKIRHQVRIRPGHLCGHARIRGSRPGVIQRNSSGSRWFRYFRQLRHSWPPSVSIYSYLYPCLSSS